MKLLIGTDYQNQPAENTKQFTTTPQAILNGNIN